MTVEQEKAHHDEQAEMAIHKALQGLFDCLENANYPPGWEATLSVVVNEEGLRIPKLEVRHA